MNSKRMSVKLALFVTAHAVLLAAATMLYDPEPQAEVQTVASAQASN